MIVAYCLSQVPKLGGGGGGGGTETTGWGTLSKTVSE